MEDFWKTLYTQITCRMAVLLIILALLTGFLGLLFTYVALWIGVILLINAGIAFLIGTAALIAHWMHQGNNRRQ